MGGIINTEEGWNTIQEELDDLEEWSNKNMMKISSTKCNVMYLGTNHKSFCYILWTQLVTEVEEGPGCISLL